MIPIFVMLRIKKEALFIGCGFVKRQVPKSCKHSETLLTDRPQGRQLLVTDISYHHFVNIWSLVPNESGKLLLSGNLFMARWSLTFALPTADRCNLKCSWSAKIIGVKLNGRVWNPPLQKMFIGFCSQEFSKFAVKISAFYRILINWYGTHWSVE